MRRLPAVRLDHAGSGHAWPRWPLALTACAACGCAFLSYQAVDLAGRAAVLDGQVQAAQARRAAAARLRSGPKPTPAALAEQRALGQVQEAMDRPWERLFVALEQAGGPDVSLLTLAPQGFRAEASLGGEARSMAALLVFMRRLHDGGFFTQVYLHDHHVDPADAFRPVRFSLQLKWRET